MDWQAALRARLLADADVAAQVGSRISWVERPQATALPAIVLQTITDEHPQHMAGFQHFRSARVQIDVWATGHKTAFDIAESVIAALAPRATEDGVRFDRAFVDGRREGGEDVSGKFVHRTSIDLIVWHSPA